MGNLCRDPKSGNWYWIYRAGPKKRLKKSTKIPIGKSAEEQAENKQKAREVGLAIEEAERIVSHNGAAEQQLRKLIDETLSRFGHPKLDDPAISEWLTRWLQNQRNTIAEDTLRRYTNAIDAFLAFISSRAKGKLRSITSPEILQFRDHLLSQGRSPATVNLLVSKTLKRALQAAVEEGILNRNPASGIRSLRDLCAATYRATHERAATLAASIECVLPYRKENPVSYEPTRLHTTNVNR